MIIAGHDYNCRQTARKIPETGQRLFVLIHPDDEVCQQALLFVSLGDGHLVKIDPIELPVKTCRTIIEIVGTYRLKTIPFLT